MHCPENGTPCTQTAPRRRACGGILAQSEIRVNLGICIRIAAPPLPARAYTYTRRARLSRRGLSRKDQREDQRRDREDREDQRRRKDRKDQPEFEWRERWRERWSARERYAVEHCHLSWPSHNVSMRPTRQKVPRLTQLQPGYCGLGGTDTSNIIAS